jgi:hypothetical protein
MREETMINPSRRARFGILVVAAGLLAVGACSSDSGSTASAPSAPPPATGQPETVIGETYAQTEATIQAIDKTARTVTLRMADGTMQTVTVPADADLTKRKPGEVVILEALQRVSVRALPPGSAPLGVRREMATVKAKPGETPGRADAEVTVLVTEVAAVDIARNTVTLRGADGSLRTLNVKNPDNQRKLQTLKVGDLVQFDVIEAVAVGLKPKA